MNPEYQVITLILNTTLTLNANIKTDFFFFLFNKLSVLMTGTERLSPKNVIFTKLFLNKPFNGIPRN